MSKKSFVGPRVQTESLKEFRLRGRRESFNVGARTTFSVIGLVFFVILMIAVFRVLMGHAPVTFTGFLQYLQNAPSIPLGWMSVLDYSFAQAFPSFLVWLGYILDFFVDIFRVAMFVSVAVLNALIFIFYFLQWLFVV